jgi:hypothetical protein
VYLISVRADVAATAFSDSNKKHTTEDVYKQLEAHHRRGTVPARPYVLAALRTAEVQQALT